MYKVLAAVIALAYLCIIAPYGVYAEDTNKSCMRVGADESLDRYYAIFSGLGEQLYTEAGLCSVFIALPIKRIEKMLADNQLDADLLRMESYPQTFNTSLIEVPQPLFEIDTVLLSMNANSFDGNIASLTGRTIAFQAGFRWLEQNISAAGAVAREIPANASIKELLERGRISIFATDSVRASDIIQEFGDQRSNVRVTFWLKTKFHHLVHQRHRDKIPAINDALKRLIARGDFDKIFSLPGLERAN